MSNVRSPKKCTFCRPRFFSRIWYAYEKRGEPYDKLWLRTRSGSDQKPARQLVALQDYGIPSKHIFADKQSGKDFERAEYRRLLSILKEGDLVVVLSLDRLGRNYEQILAEWERITKELKADDVVLDMPLPDTRARANTLVGRFIADVVLQVLSFVAETERSNIRARQAEGIRLAKARGVKFGRPRKIYTEEFCSVIRAYKEKRVALQDALIILGVGKATFYKHLHRLT